MGDDVDVLREGRVRPDGALVRRRGRELLEEGGREREVAQRGHGGLLQRVLRLEVREHLANDVARRCSSVPSSFSENYS